MLQHLLRFYLSFAAVFSACRLLAADSTARTHDITIEDLFTLGQLTECATSPDGKCVAFAQGRWLESANNRKKDLWLVTVDGRKTTKLTFDRANDRSAQWSGDGRRIFFIGERSRGGETLPPYDGTSQIWQIGTDAGMPVAITMIPDGVAAYTLASESNQIFFIVEPNKTQADEWGELRSRFGGVDYSAGAKYSTRVYRLDLSDWRVALFKEVEGACHEVAVDSNGERIALTVAPEDTVDSFESRSKVTIIDCATLQEIDLPDDKWRRPGRPYGEVKSPTWSGDGRLLSFFISHDAYPNEVFVAAVDASREVSVTSLPAPKGATFRNDGDAEFRMQWISDTNDLAVLCDDHARSRIYVAQNVHNGAQITYKRLTNEDEVVDWFSASADGSVISCVLSDPRKMWEVAIVGEPIRTITTANGHTDSWKAPQIVTKTWMNGGTTIEGVLEVPYGYDLDAGGALPTIVNLHGGPTTSWHCNLIYGYLGSVLFASRGYAFFSPNFRGSTGYGDEFITDLIGHQNEIEVEDILGGIDKLVDDGIASPDQLGLVGWSYGGYLTNCLIGRPRYRFKAASAGGCVSESTLEWGASDEPAFEVAFQKGLPWTDPDIYRRSSPIYGLGNAETPTLFHVGSLDERCPPANSRLAFRALRTVGVPCELLVYRGEGHGLNAYQSRLAKMRWDVEWFKKYLPVKQ